MTESEQILPCRTVAEAHLYLDIAGASREDRDHRLEARGDDLVSVYTCAVGEEKRTFIFLSPPDPLGVEGFGGPEPSRILDPGQFLAHASRLAASMPLDPADLDPALHEIAIARLETAAQCVEEVLKFLPKGMDQVPEAAFVSEEGREVHRAEPGRFRRARLVAVAETYRGVARRYRGD